MSAERVDRSHWSAYWLGTRSLNSFEGGDQAGQYGGAVREFWQQQLNRCGPNPLLLDVGTGNGALAFLAAAYLGRSTGFQSIIAVDAADIAPLDAINHDVELVALSRKIQFLPRTRIESTPLSDGSVDFAMSQFGFEYSQQDMSIREIARVLKPGGHCVFVVHDKCTDIIADSYVGINVLEHGLERTALFSVAKELLIAMRTGIDINSVDLKFRSIARELMEKFSSSAERGWFSSVLRSLVDIISLAFQGQHQLAFSLFDKNHASQTSALSRLREQVSVAFDSDRADVLAQQCAAEAFRLETEVLSIGGRAFGRVLYICRKTGL